MKKRVSWQLVSITSLFLLAIIIGATYAYFQAQKGKGTSSNITIQAGTTDALTFSNGDAILINANQDNFKSGSANITDETVVTATLTPNNNTNIATDYYNIYLVIENNELDYTTQELKPELILKVTDPNGDMITEMKGFTYIKDQGFDITNIKHGAYPIKLKQEITAENVAKIDEWQIEVTLVNLGSNQNKNAGKSFKGSILITPQDVETYDLAEIKKITSTTTYKSIKTNLEIEEGTNSIDTYYFAIEETDEEPQNINMLSLSEAMSYSYHESKEASYEFTTTDDGKPLKENQNYKIYSYAVDTEGYQSNIYETIITTDSYQIPEVNVATETTINSIKLKITVISHDGNINKYTITKNSEPEIELEGTNYIEYIFDNLDAATQYNIKVVAHDENNRVSNPYIETITTVAKTFTLLANANIENNAFKITNMIKNGSYENGEENWVLGYKVEITTKYASDGMHSLKFNTVNDLSMTSQELEVTAPTYQHSYYGRLKFLSNLNFCTNDCRFEWYAGEEIAINDLRFAYKQIQVNNWTLMSDIATLKSNEYTNVPWKIRNFQVKPNSDSYTDELMMIDLTETYGANIPTKKYLDENLVYFDGTVSIKSIEVKEGIFKVNVNTGNIECTDGGQANLASDGTITITGTQKTTTCYLK